MVNQLIKEKSKQSKLLWATKTKTKYISNPPQKRRALDLDPLPLPVPFADVFVVDINNLQFTPRLLCGVKLHQKRNIGDRFQSREQLVVAKGGAAGCPRVQDVVHQICNALEVAASERVQVLQLDVRGLWIEALDAREQLPVLSKDIRGLLDLVEWDVQAHQLFI